VTSAHTMRTSADATSERRDNEADNERAAAARAADVARVFAVRNRSRMSRRRRGDEARAHVGETRAHAGTCTSARGDVHGRSGPLASALASDPFSRGREKWLATPRAFSHAVVVG
jgi:hypothetical protein